MHDLLVEIQNDLRNQVSVSAKFFHSILYMSYFLLGIKYHIYIMPPRTRKTMGISDIAHDDPCGDPIRGTCDLLNTALVPKE